jgi:hypothetical protein
MEYTTVETTDSGELCLYVNAMISTGWTPLGGVAVTQTIIDHPGKFGMPGNREVVSNYCQAMTKEETQNA